MRMPNTKTSFISNQRRRGNAMTKQTELVVGYVEVSDNMDFKPDTSCMPSVPVCSLCEEKLSEYIDSQDYKPYEFGA